MVGSRKPSSATAAGTSRAGKAEVLEGDWEPHRLVILEFESMGRVREWYDSPEYAPLKQLRDEVAVTEFVVVEGL